MTATSTTSTTSARILALLSLLQTRRDWPGHLLARRLGISDRTVCRDIERLRGLGYRIRTIKGPDGGYRLDAGSELPPLLFDDEQAVALAVALRVAATSGAGIDEASARALATVRQVLPARLRHRIDTFEFTAVGTGASPVETQVLLALSAAVRDRAVLRFDYASAAGSPHHGDDLPPPRRVEPHAVASRSGRWYLLAWDLDQGDWRIFRADRITPRVPTGPRFDRRALPAGDVATFLSARFKGSGTTDEWPCQGEAVLHADAARVAPFAHDGVVEMLAPGRCLLRLGSWSWAGLAAALLRFDVTIEQVAPAELRAAFARLSERCTHASSAPRRLRVGTSPAGDGERPGGHEQDQGQHPAGRGEPGTGECSGEQRSEAGTGTDEEGIPGQAGPSR